MRREFTGWHMLAVLVGGFGVVVAVNLVMATLAVRGFSGVVVENSYVASQKFNGWLEEAKRETDLGWSATMDRDQAGRLTVLTKDVPAGATVTTAIRRPIGPPEHETLTLAQMGPDRFASHDPLPDGRWIARLKISFEGRDWSTERELP